MKRLVLTLAMLALPLAAQAPKKEARPAAAQEPTATEQPKPPQAQKLFILKYADPNQIRPLINIFTVSIMVNSAMRALAVSAPASSMPAIEDAINRLDTPSAAPRDVDLMAYFLVGGQAEAMPAGHLPAELDAVVSELKMAFSYTNYQLMDALSMRVRTGGQMADTTGNQGSVRVYDNIQPIETRFHVNSVSIGADGTIRIDGLRASKSVPHATLQGPSGSPAVAYADFGINTDVSLKEGQKLVVGKTSIDPNEALFVVLTAHVVQ